MKQFEEKLNKLFNMETFEQKPPEIKKIEETNNDKKEYIKDRYELRYILVTMHIVMLEYFIFKFKINIIKY